MPSISRYINKNFSIATPSGSFTYHEIISACYSIMKRLSRFSISGSAIGVYMEKSPELVAVILGIILSENTYVPLDKAFPDDRIGYILEDASIELIITDQRNVSKIFENKHVIMIEELPSAISTDMPFSIPDEISNENLMIRYTSGSTGKPKGVVVSQHCIITRLEWIKAFYDHGDNDVYCLKTNLAFADSILEIFTPIMQGRTLFIPLETELSQPDRLVNYFLKFKVSTLYVVPTFLTLITRFCLANQITMPNLRYLMIGGEPLTLELIEKFYTIAPNAKMLNFYGLTEVGGAIFLDTSSFKPKKLQRIPVGIPLPFVKAYILDNNLRPVPPNQKGTLFIGGEGLTKGYLNLPNIQAKKFIAHPETGERIFNTGDLFCINKNGLYDFVCREDFQVKIKGYRVELTEIEKTLEERPDIYRSIIFQDQHNKNNLVCYYGAKAPIEKPKLLQHLKNKLPTYMCPKYFIFLDDLPLTETGKVDRNGLKKRWLDNDHKIVIPKTNCTNNTVMSLLKDALNYKNFTSDVDLTSLGLDSIQIINLCFDINDTFNTKLTVADLYKARSIEAISHLVNRHPNEKNEEKGFKQAKANLNHKKLRALPIQVSYYTGQSRYSKYGGKHAFTYHCFNGEFNEASLVKALEECVEIFPISHYCFSLSEQSFIKKRNPHCLVLLKGMRSLEDMFSQRPYNNEVTVGYEVNKKPGITICLPLLFFDADSSILFFDLLDDVYSDQRTTQLTHLDSLPKTINKIDIVRKYVDSYHGPIENKSKISQSKISERNIIQVPLESWEAYYKKVGHQIEVTETICSLYLFLKAIVGFVDQKNININILSKINMPQPNAPLNFTTSIPLTINKSNLSIQAINQELLGNYLAKPYLAIEVDSKDRSSSFISFSSMLHSNEFREYQFGRKTDSGASTPNVLMDCVVRKRDKSFEFMLFTPDSVVDKETIRQISDNIIKAIKSC